MKDKVDRVTGEILAPGVRPVLKMSYDDHMAASDFTGLSCGDESLASQSSLEESDINVLVRRFGLVETPTGVRAPFYGDFTGIGSYQDALNVLVAAQGSFMAMPAEVRSEFDNDPHRFVDFCSKDENYDRMIELGMIAPEPMKRRIEARRAEEAAKRDADINAEIERRQKASKEA